MCDFFSSNKLKEVEKAQRKTHETNATYHMVASKKNHEVVDKLLFFEKSDFLQLNQFGANLEPTIV